MRGRDRCKGIQAQLQAPLHRGRPFIDEETCMLAKAKIRVGGSFSRGPLPQMYISPGGVLKGSPPGYHILC
eukprot:754753-Hanusia_phi.AAC.2